jgi:SAM-dependent methyltransferase
MQRRAHDDERATLFDRVRRGEPWTPDEANEFLVAFHAARPGVTGRSLSDSRDEQGRTSYELTAACVPEDARVVLDIACGDGELLLPIGRRLGGRAELVGVDLSAVDLELGRTRLTGFRARLICESAERVSVAAGTVDAVVCHYALMLMRPIEAVLAEVARVLRPGGVFVACVPSGVTVDRPSAETRALLLEVIRGDIPAYPDNGLGDARVKDDAALGELLASAGFEPPSVEVHTIACDLTPAATLEGMRDYYWWDMIQEESRARLERELPPLLDREAGGTGRIRQGTKLRMISARRRV